MKIPKKTNIKNTKTYITFLAKEFFCCYTALINKNIPATNAHYLAWRSHKLSRCSRQFCPVRNPDGWRGLVVTCIWNWVSGWTLRSSWPPRYALTPAYSPTVPVPPPTASPPLYSPTGVWSLHQTATCYSFLFLFNEKATAVDHFSVGVLMYVSFRLKRWLYLWRLKMVIF